MLAKTEGGIKSKIHCLPAPHSRFHFTNNMANNQPTPPPPRRTRDELQQLYIGALEKEGYRAERDDDGDVRFRHEGHLYFLEVREDDPMFFRVVLPNFWDIDSPAERLRIIDAANLASGDTKVAKIFIVRESTWAACELFLPAQEDFVAILQRCLLAIRAAVSLFSEAMRNEPPKPPSFEPPSFPPSA